MVRKKILDFFSNIFDSSNPKRVPYAHFTIQAQKDKKDYSLMTRLKNKNKKFIPKPFRRFFWV